MKFYAFLCCLVAVSLVLTPAIALVGNTQQTNTVQEEEKPPSEQTAVKQQVRKDDE